MSLKGAVKAVIGDKIKFEDENGDVVSVRAAPMAQLQRFLLRGAVAAGAAERWCE